jgi:hypothetical protein
VLDGDEGSQCTAVADIETRRRSAEGVADGDDEVELGGGSGLADGGVEWDMAGS